MDDAKKISPLLATIFDVIAECSGTDVRTVARDFQNFYKEIDKLKEKGLTEDEARSVVAATWDFPLLFNEEER